MQQHLYPTISVTATKADVTHPISGQLYYFQNTKKLAIGVSSSGSTTLEDLGYLPLTGGVVDTITIDNGMYNTVHIIPESAVSCVLTEGVFKHAPTTAPTYTLPTVVDTTMTHSIVLYLDLANTASFSFQDTAGNPIIVDTIGVPAVGECWTIWAEYIHGEWIVRGMRDKEAQA